jgi:hypothetical protein
MRAQDMDLLVKAREMKRSNEKRKRKKNKVIYGIENERFSITQD